MVKWQLSWLKTEIMWPLLILTSKRPVFKPSQFLDAKQPKFGLVEFVEQYIASASNTPAVPKIIFLFKANKKKAGTFLDHAPLANTQIIEQKLARRQLTNRAIFGSCPRGGSKADPTSIDWIKLYDE